MAKQIMTNANELSVGQDIHICISSGASYSMVTCHSIHGTIVEERPAAICIKVWFAKPWSNGKEVTLWLPKKAIVEAPADEPHVAEYWAKNGGRMFPPMKRLAQWFTPDAYACRVFDRIDEHATTINWPPSQAA